MNNDVIIINGAFVGGYGKSGENLPHEMINFFRADNEQFYVYITPLGVLNAKYSIKDIKGILFVRNAGNSLVEVLAKAEVNENSEYFTKNIKLSKKQISSKKAKEEYVKNIETENICYGSATLSQIHEKNKIDNDIYVTLRVDKICLPKKTFYLTYNTQKQAKDVLLISEENKKRGKKINNQSMLAYYEKNSVTNSYKTLEMIIKDEKNEYWKDANDTPKLELDKIQDNHSFLKITRQQDNELVFSRLRALVS